MAWALKPGRDLLFLPAYPRDVPRLEVDSVNSHHPAYYMEERAVPTETESPVPAYLLTVAPGQDFVLRVESLSKSEESIRRGFDLLATGLAYLGIGGKTAAGYGILEERG